MSRLIDADEIRIKPDFIFYGVCGTPVIRCEDLARIINDMPTIEPQKWIPAAERFPEDEQVVLVQDTNGTIWIWKYLGENLEYRGPYQWMDDNEVWQLIDEVVAWMPLPECYGGD